MDPSTVTQPRISGNEQAYIGLVWQLDSAGIKMPDMLSYILFSTALVTSEEAEVRLALTVAEGALVPT